MFTNGVVRRATLALWDVMCWTLGVAFVIGLRYSFQVSEVQWEAVLRFLVVSWLLIATVGYATKFYRGRFLVGSFEEALGLAAHFLGVAAVMIVSAPLLNPTLPRSLPVLAPPVALVAAAAGRWFYRALRDRGAEVPAASLRPVLIYGAGDSGRQVLRLVRTDPTLRLRAVGFLDDNTGKRHLRIQGVPVLGSGRPWPRSLRRPTPRRWSSPSRAPRASSSTGSSATPPRPASRSTSCPGWATSSADR